MEQQNQLNDTERLKSVTSVNTININHAQASIISFDKTMGDYKDHASNAQCLRLRNTVPTIMHVVSCSLDCVRLYL